jgi:hypothetical protein
VVRADDVQSDAPAALGDVSVEVAGPTLRAHDPYLTWLAAPTQRIDRVHL